MSKAFNNYFIITLLNSKIKESKLSLRNYLIRFFGFIKYQAFLFIKLNKKNIKDGKK